MTVFISIGNSDDRLSQATWSEFCRDVDAAVRFRALDDKPTVHGQWASDSTSMWQNACWCVDLSDALAVRLRRVLRLLACEYGQDSIAWAEATTEFLTPGGAS